MASPWGSDFFLLSQSWPGQYRRFILGDAKRRWITEQFSSRLGEYCRWMCDVDWFGTFGISLPAMNYTNYIYYISCSLSCVVRCSSIDIHVANVCNVNAMWILNVHMPCMHRCVKDTVSNDVVRCSLFRGTFFRVPSCWYFSWPHLWREDFIAAICCNDGPLPLASTYVDGCWWHWNLNSVRCSNYNHVTN